MISFRLTDEEYERFRRLCVTRGLRNVSELVRSAVNQLLESVDEGPPRPGMNIEARVGTLESRIADLALAVADIERRLDGDGNTFSRAATH